MTMPHFAGFDMEPVTAAPVAPPPCAPKPSILVTTERMMVDRGTILDPDYEEVEVPVVQLSFRYRDVVVSASDRSDRFFLAVGGALQPVARDLRAEASARRLLESFGVVEVGCIDDYIPPIDSAADYVVKVDGDVHAYCTFGAYALPQLRSRGFEVTVADDYPYTVLSGETPWYADVEPDEEEPDWFSLELGIEVDGTRVDLLPTLVDLLDSSQSIESLFGRKLLAVAVGGNYLAVPPERLRRIIEVLKELYDNESRRLVKDEDGNGVVLRFRREEGTQLDELDDAVGQTKIKWRGDAEARSFARRLGSTPVQEVQVAQGLQASLRPYQSEGLAWLQHLRALGVGGILADDMGLGKTLQTISHLATEKESGRMTSPCLVVAPTSLLENWRREISKFAPFLKVAVLHGSRRRSVAEAYEAADVLVTTYGLLARDLEDWCERHLYLVVLDEAQAIKNPRSQSHQAVKALNADLRVCLSGTPVENDLSELWAQFDFLNPGFLGTAEQFRSRFKAPIDAGNEAQLERLRKRVAPFILRRMKSQVVTELPPKTEIVRAISLDGPQRELYESIRVAAHGEVRRVIRRKGLAAATVQVLDALMKLRQVCCDPRLLNVQSARQVNSSAKYDALMELVKQLREDGRRPLIFSQFTSMLELISRGLSGEGIDHVTLTGGTPNRQALVDAFQRGDIDVFLISLKAGGTGLNLTTADTIIHVDPWWNPAAQAQATDRAYRIGQRNPVFVYNLIVSGSVEERMLRLQERKKQLADAILSGAARGPSAFDQDDLDDLFAPLDA